MKRTIWIVTADWYDRHDYYPASAGTRRDAIKDFIAMWTEPLTWKQYRRKGWRCVRATVTW